MLISTRGRYALRVLLDLAENSRDRYIPMKEVAQRQDLSLKYLERILPVLVKNGYVTGVHGKGGGYRLCGEPAQLRIGDILRLTEGDLKPVGCMDCADGECVRSDTCRTRPLWNGLNRVVNEYLDSVTLADLMEGDVL